MAKKLFLISVVMLFVLSGVVFAEKKDKKDKNDNNLKIQIQQALNQVEQDNNYAEVFVKGVSFDLSLLPSVNPQKK